MPQKIFPLWNFATKGKSSNVSAQRRINLYAETFGGKTEDKTRVALYGRPGLLKGFNDAAAGTGGDPSYGGPLRGLIVVPGITQGSEYIYGAQGDHRVLSVYPGVFLTRETLFLTTSGPVQFASNGLLNNYGVVAVDGETGYIPALNTTMAAEGVTTFPDGARSICFLAGRFFVEDPAAPGQFRWSGVFDALTWDPLAFATAESAPDPLVQVFERGGELLLFGNRTIEFWAPTGDDAVVARVGGSGIDWGLGIFDSPRKANDYVLFIGRNLGGQPQVCMLQGYTVRVVSTPDVERELNAALTAGAQPVTSVVTHSGHTWYIVNLGSTSPAYDVTTGDWGEWQTMTAAGARGRWAGNYSSQYRNQAIVTDYRDGRVYYLDAERYTDDVTPIPRVVIGRHIFNNLEPTTISRLQLDMETGVGLISGQGNAPQAMLRISKDGGHTWGPEIWRDIGAMGGYLKTVSWNGLGQADDFVFEVTIADPVKVALINGALTVG